MDKQLPSNGTVNPGISIRHGPVEDTNMDDGPPVTNGATNGAANGKRKSRGSISKTYKEATSSDEDENKPLVRPDEFAILLVPR